MSSEVKVQCSELASLEVISTSELFSLNSELYSRGARP